MVDELLLATPIELPFGDKIYKMSPLTDKDQSELNQWVRAQYINNARLSLPKDVSELEYRLLMSTAMRDALCLTWSRLPGRNAFITPEGSARLAWQSIKRNQKDVTEDELLVCVNNAKFLFEFEKLFLQINAPPQSAIDYVENQLKQKGDNGEADAQSFQNLKSTVK